MAKASILIIDDERGLRQLLSKVLKKEGYTVLTAASGEEAIEIVKNQKVNLALVDLNMPGISGIEAIRWIKKIDGSIVHVIITAYGEKESVKEATDLGVFDYVTKPFDLEYIKALIKHLLVDIKSEVLPFAKDLDKVFTGELTQREAIKRKLALLKEEVKTRTESLKETGNNLDRQMASLYSSVHEFVFYRFKNAVRKTYFIVLVLAILVGTTFGYIYTYITKRISTSRAESLSRKERVTLKDFYEKLDGIEYWMKKNAEEEMELRGEEGFLER